MPPKKSSKRQLDQAGAAELLSSLSRRQKQKVNEDLDDLPATLHLGGQLFRLPRVPRNTLLADIVKIIRVEANQQLEQSSLFIRTRACKQSPMFLPFTFRRARISAFASITI